MAINYKSDLGDVCRMIRIGAFGTIKTIEYLQTFVEHEKNIRIIPFTYSHPKEAKSQLQQAFGCDVFLFTGPVPYIYAKDVLNETTIPHVFVEFDQLMISNSFNLIYKNEALHVKDLSIDIMHKEDVYEVLDVLEIDKDLLHVFDFSDQEPFKISEIIKFHEHLWQEGKVRMVLTSIAAVEERLKERGIPCLKMPIPRKNLELALQEAETLGELRLSKTAKIVVGLAKIKNFETKIDQLDDFKVEKAQLTLHQMLLRFTHEMGLSLYKGNNTFVIFGTKGSLDNLVSSNTLHEYVKEIEQSLKVYLVIGFGSGNTAPEAEENAKIAMRRALQDDASSCYVYEDGSYVPVHSYAGVHMQRENLINQVIQAENITLESATTFVDFLILNDFQPFTAHEYAFYGKVTTRTAARFIKKMVDNGLLELAGEQKLFEKGRPRTMYELKEMLT